MASSFRFSLLVLAACGARSPLDLLDDGQSASSGTPDGGGAALPDGGVVSDSGSVILTAPTCPKWAPTHAPVQVSAPSGGILGLQTAVPTNDGVLVGYADILFPPNDPTWHLRRISYDGATLGPVNTPFHRDTSQLGWTAISVAHGPPLAAIAWDQTQGLQFAPLDSTGATTAAITGTPGDQGRVLVATPGGFTMLSTPYRGMRSPVSLATLDASGHRIGTRVLVTSVQPAATIDPVGRALYADGSFLLVWSEGGGCGAMCQASYAQHFSQTGDVLGARVVVRAVYAAAPSSRGVLFAWIAGTAGKLTLETSPRDANGAPIGADAQITPIVGQNQGEVAAATAPGGDVIVAWTADTDAKRSELFVQAVAATGEAEGPPVSLGAIANYSEQTLRVASSAQGTMVLYQDRSTNQGSQVFAIPLRCAQ